MVIRDKSLSHVLLTILLLGAMVVPIWPATVHAGLPAAPAYKPSITDVVLAKALDDGQKPVETTESFGATDVFYCSVYVTDAQVGTKVAAKWYHVDQTIDEASVTMDRTGSGYVGFNLTSATGNWPTDDGYRVEISLDGILAKTLNFAVVAASTSVTSRIKSATLTREVDENFKPTAPTLLFGTTDTVHCSVRADLAIGANVTAQWYQNGALYEDQIVTYTAKSNYQDVYVHFYLEPKQPFAAGPYSVEILLDGKLARTLKFMVREGATPPVKRTPSAKVTTSAKTTPLAVTTPTRPAKATATPTPTATAVAEATVGPIAFATEVDAGKQPVEPGTQFPAGTKTIYAVFDYGGFMQGSAFEQIWYLDDKETARGSFDWTEAESGSYEGSLNNDQGLLGGTYRLDIQLNGNVLGSGEFVIEPGAAPEATQTPTAEAPTIEPETPTVQAPTLEPETPTAEAPTLEPETPTAEPPTVEAVALPTFGPISFSEGLPDGSVGVASTSFSASIKTIVAVFDYSGMSADAEYTASLFAGDKKVFSQTEIWQQSEKGTGAAVRLSTSTGFRPGTYRLELTVNSQVIQTGEFEIVEAAATNTPEPPTPTPAATPVPVPTKAKVAGGAFRIAYTRTDNGVHSIWVMDLNGKGQKKIANYASDPAWASDGKSLVIFGWDGDPRGGSGIYQINADGTGARLIWNEGTAAYLTWARSAARWVAMSGLKGILVYDGKEGKWQAVSPGEQPSFAPDGNSLVAHTCLGPDCGLFVMGRDGSGKRRITNSADDFMPNWSPTAKRIAYAKKAGNTWEIWTVNPDGSGPKQLTSDPSINAMPVWLPDGSGIVYRSTRGGSWGIWIMNADGTNPRKIIDAPTADDWGRDRLDVR